jgi:hypothetical protein
MPQHIVCRAAGVVNMGNQNGPDPVNVIWRALKLLGTGLHRFEPGKKPAQCRSIEPGSNFAAILQFPVDPFAECQ